MAAVGDYIKLLTRRIVALHEASALTTTIGDASKTFAQAVALRSRVHRSYDLPADKHRQHQAGTRGADERLEWDLIPRRMTAGPAAAPVTFGASARTSPPTCPQLLNKTLVFELTITGPDGRQDAVTSLGLLSEHILIHAGAGLSPAGYTDLPWVRGVGVIGSTFEEVRLSPTGEGEMRGATGRGPLFRGRFEIPVAVSLVTTTDILGA